MNTSIVTLPRTDWSKQLLRTDWGKRLTRPIVAIAIIMALWAGANLKDLKGPFEPGCSNDTPSLITQPISPAGIYCFPDSNLSKEYRVTPPDRGTHIVYRNGQFLPLPIGQ